MRKIEMLGARFGRLTVVSEADRRRDAAGAWRRYFNVKCDCGGTGCIRGNDLRSGYTRSCGCLQVENRRVSSIRHGGASGANRSREYRIWCGMLSRCRNPKVARYPRYGGRGITVCDRWAVGDGTSGGFECFLADMGRCPTSQHSIDRFPNNDGNYEPGNCRWATRVEQGHSKRKAKTS